MIFIKKKTKDQKVLTKLELPLIRQKMIASDGFKTEEEALQFGNNSCGAACLEMILEAFRIKNNLSVKQIQETGIKKKYYNDSVGWLHTGLVQMAKDFGLQSSTTKFSRPEKLLDELKNNRLLVASVSYGFDQKKKGGHLIVVRGVSFKDGKLQKVYFNDPSSFGQTHNEIDGESFLKSWSGNVIILGKM